MKGKGTGWVWGSGGLQLPKFLDFLRIRESFKHWRTERGFVSISQG